jgi:outer membrane protein assembly factor BamD (BamD/ComL family)
MKLKSTVKYLVAAIAFFAMFAGTSCASRPAVIPYDLTPMELIQRGQEASSRNRFALALQHYRTLLERFPDDLYFTCAAEYEIAFIYYRRRNFEDARIKFNDLLARYDSPDAELLPPQFRVLSEIVLARIDEAELRGRRR